MTCFAKPMGRVESDGRKTGTVFVREATGLVRSMNWVDLMFLNIVSFGGAWSIIYALEYAPYYGGDPAFSLLLTAPGVLALLGVYYILNSSMPRSGGDYIYVSRILHPAIGFAANFIGYTVFLWFWIGDAASVFSSNGLAQTLSVYGSLAHSAWAQSASTWPGVPLNNFILGTITILGFAAIVILRTRLYFWVQNILMTVAVITLAIIGLLLIIALANPTGFQSSFNSYATNIGAGLTPNAYANLTVSGAAVAPDHSVSNLGQNVLLIPLWFTVLFWVFVSNYLGGETKNAKSTVKKSLFGSFAIIFVATLVILETAYYALGFNFILGADNVIYGYASNPFGALPNLTLLVSVLANNSLLVIFLGIGIVAGFILVAPQCMILMSRILFSYSFDRMAPGWIADINQRFGTPFKAVIIAVVGGEVMLAFISGIFGTATSNSALTLYTYAGLATIGLTFTFVSLSAIVFPYKKKDLYNSISSVKTKIAGVPVITWLGIIAFGYSAATIIWYSYDQVFYTFGCPGGGATGCDFNYFLIFLIVLFFVAVAYYFGVRAVRTQKGIPFDLAFAEIPPE